MSNFIVSARKYRPAKFEEVVGQAHVADTLKNALQSEKLAHSFLFCGPRGVGKTTCARILAKVINCQNPVDKTTPCNTCSSCTSFNDNASFNIIELDAASNNSVDNIRNLIDQVRVPPQQGRYKVFIIDEVHMLSTAAFNAFLKTLEEPPAYAIFILATTEKHKILPTILSRCQIFDFKRIQVADIAAQLSEICRQEGITAEPEALHLIGQKADGAMRDALSIFDKVASSSTDSTLTYKDVITNLNILDYDYYFRVVDSFLREDLSKVLLIVEEVVAQGFDIDQFIQGLAAHMRDLLVCKDQRTLPLLDVSGQLKERYIQQASYATRSMLLSALDILNQCDITLPRSTNKRLYAEIALSKINFIQRAVDTVLSDGPAPTIEKKTNVVNGPAAEVAPPQPTAKATPQPPAEVQRPAIPNIDVQIPATPTPAAKDENVDKAPEHTAVPPVENNVEVPPTEPQIEQPPTNDSANEVTVPTPLKKEEPAQAAAVPEVAVDLSISSMMAELEQEAKALDAAKELFGIESIQELWSHYAKTNQSPSVRAALNRTLLQLEGDSKLVVTVPSNMTGQIVLNEIQLLDRVRNDLGATGLIFDINVDPEQFPDYEKAEQSSTLLPTEKYQLMLNKKPELKDLITKLDLKPDNDVAL